MVFIDRDPLEKQLIDALVDHCKREMARKQLIDALVDHRKREIARKEQTGQDYEKWQGDEQERKNAAYTAKYLTERVQKVTRAVLALCSGLYEEPILVDSGRVQPRKRVRYIVHPQRTYQDVQNELAQELTNINQFTALVRTSEDMHRVRILPPAPGPTAAKAWGIVEEVRQRSRERYGRPWEDGGGSLPGNPQPPPGGAGPAGRQTNPDQPAAPPLRPTRSRKPPRKPPTSQP